MVSNPNMMNPGSAILAINYTTPITGGYRAVSGYHLLGGAPPAGTGPILGLCVWHGDVFCIRENAGTGTLYKLTGGSWVSVGTGLEVGLHEFASGTFQALAASEALYMVGGGKPWVWDGTSLSEIVAAPSGGSYIAVHANHLVVGLPSGSVQWSEMGDPTSWDAAGGAGELGAADAVTGLAAAAGGVLVIGCRDTIKLLYGSSVDDFVVRTHSENAGVKPRTMRAMGAMPVFQSSLGLTSLEAVQSYANFAFGSWARAVKPLLSNQSADPIGAVSLKQENQYRLYFPSGLVLVATFNGTQPVGITTLLYPDAPTLVASGDSADLRSDVTVFADSQANIYLTDAGTSFNGQDIRTVLALAYNHFGHTTLRKRMRRLWLDIEAESPAELFVLPSYNLGNDIARAPVAVMQALTAGGLWDFDRWGEFAWSTPMLDMHPMMLSGSATHIGPVVNSSSSVALPHTIRGYTVQFDPRRESRGK